MKTYSWGLNYITIASKVTKTCEAQVQIMINMCTKFEFNPFTPWGSYGRHRHQLLHSERSTTDTSVCHKHTTGELKIKLGQQRSRMTRLNIITARRFLAIKNQFQLAMPEFGYLGHQIGSSALDSIHM